MRSLINNTIKNSGLVAVIAAVVMVVGGGSAVAGQLITSKQVKNNSLTGADIRTGSVTGSDIKNKSVNASDLTDSARNSLKGNAGPQGVPGHGTIASFSNDNQQQTNGTSWHEAVPGQQVTVPAGASKVLVAFNAECGITDSDGIHRALYIVVRVNGEIVGNQNRMCNNAADLDDLRYATHTVNRVLDLAPGTYSISVDFGVPSANSTGYLDTKLFTATVGS